MSHPIPTQDYPCPNCGEQPNDCQCASTPELGQMSRIPDDDYYHDKYLDQQAQLDWESRDTYYK